MRCCQGTEPSMCFQHDEDTISSKDRKESKENRCLRKPVHCMKPKLGILAQEKTRAGEREPCLDTCTMEDVQQLSHQSYMIHCSVPLRKGSGSWFATAD